jgi:hypothetical protein
MIKIFATFDKMHMKQKSKENSKLDFIKITNFSQKTDRQTHTQHMKVFRALFTNAKNWKQAHCTTGKL